MSRALTLLILVLSSLTLPAAFASHTSGGSGSHAGGGGAAAHASAGAHALPARGPVDPGSRSTTFTTGSHVAVAAQAHAATPNDARVATVQPVRPARPNWWRRLFHQQQSSANGPVQSFCVENRYAPECRPSPSNPAPTAVRR